ncbi:Uncharacterised protein [Escherichia coli]|uniref:DUF4754 domain-containing protein n=4 Tax=Escherichia coli TaxID=562 RepID=A0A376M700_ECOLX|nr:Uncharacterised protein [Escherichia coli]
MDKEYKTLINKALERFYFRLSASGAHAERAARDSLTRAIRSLYDVAFYADDLDALNELSELICAAECGEHIEPLLHEYIYLMACPDYFGGLRHWDYANYSFSKKD